MSVIKNKQALVFFSAGVGDSILLVPLINQLKEEGFIVTGLFTSIFNCESVFKNTFLLDSIVVKKRKLALIQFCALHIKKYDAIYLNHFSFSTINIFSAFLIGKHVFSNYTNHFYLKKYNTISIIEPKEKTHDALQNLFLLNDRFTKTDLDFDIHYLPQNTNPFSLPRNYIAIQVSSANNNAPFKNWKIDNWLELFKYLNKCLPQTTLVLLGDETEIYLNKKINSSNLNNVVSLIGKTELSEVVEIIHHSLFYLGLDSGLMHIAAALKKPTFTIWGASSPQLYGYDWMRAKKNKIVSLNLDCAPCSAWLSPNKTRVSSPFQCPDFKCITNISVTHVAKELDDFLTLL